MSNAWAAGSSSAGGEEAAANLRARVLAAASPKAILLALVGALQFADIATTNAILHLPTGRELNPLMAYAQDTLGSAWFIPKLLVVAVALMAANHYRATKLAVLLLAMSVLVVANNAAMIWFP